LHANFKLSADGEGVFLYDNNQFLLDSVTFGPQVQDKSLARIPNGTGNWFIGDHTFNKNNETSTSVTENETASGIRLYPNPASGIVNVENNSTNATLATIYNSLGVKIKDLVLPAMSTTLISDLPSGLCFLTDGHKTIKLIVL
jgi:hypothetical protein